MALIKLEDDDFHTHIRERMEQRGITKEEVEYTINHGWDSKEAKQGTFGKIFVFLFQSIWEGKFHEEKEVSVFYKLKEKIILLSTKARYGKKFPRGEMNED